MAVTTLIKCLCLLFVSLFVYMFSRQALSYYFRRQKAYRSVANSGGSVICVISRNFADLITGIINRLLGFKGIHEIANYLELNSRSKRSDWSKESILGACILASICAFLVALFISGSILFAVIALLGLPVVCYVVADSKKTSNESDIREQIPEALRCMSSCARSGLSILQTFEYVEKETNGPLKEAFGACAKRLKMGEPLCEATEVLMTFKSIPELRFVCIAISVQHATGGSLAVILEDARASVMQELDLLRNLRVQTSQARLSASIVTVMPLVLVGLFSFMSPDFLTPFFSSFAGFGLLFVAIFMQVAGVLSVRKILDVKGGVA